MHIRQNRRDFLASASLAATAGLLGAHRPLAAEGPPETTTIRLAFTTAICFAPFDVAEEFLRAEGFTDVQYVKAAGGFSSPQMAASGDLDFGVSFAGTVVYHLDAGLPITAVSGLHAGCYELFAREPIRSIGDLKGRRVGIQTLSNERAPVRLHHGQARRARPERGHRVGGAAGWQRHGAVRRRQDRRVSRLSARAAGAARPRLRSRDREHAQRPAVVAVFLLHDLRQPRLGPRSSGRDQALSARRLQGRRPSARPSPRTPRARLVDGGFAPRYDYALADDPDLPYELLARIRLRRTRCASTRFACTRRACSSSSPNALLAEGTDWRFLNELKRELKA